MGGEAAMAERINHKLMRCECRSFWQRQLSVASSRQLPVLASLPRFCLVPFGSVRFFSPLCAFSGDQTNFAHFGMPRMQMPFLSPNYTIHHISFDSTSRVKQSKSPKSSLLPSLSLSLYPVSFSFRSCSHCECVSNSPFCPNWQWEFLMGFSDAVLV